MCRFDRFYFWTVGFIGLLAVAALIGFLAGEAWPVLSVRGLSFLWETEWDVSSGRFGALPMIAGSAAVVCTALAVTLPLGLSSAIVTAEILPGTLRLAAKSLMELLAGIPSVVYGLLGIAVVIPWVQTRLGLLTGRTLLTAGLVLGIMVLPTLMTVADDALKSVSRETREAGWSLGLTPWETLWHCVVREAFPGVLAAVLLSLGRALGETIAVMLLVGSLDRSPMPWYNWATPGQTLTSKIGREVAEAAFGSPQYHALAALGVVLMAIVLAFTLMGQWIVVKRITHLGH